MTRWSVELGNPPTDLRLFGDLLGQLGITLDLSHNPPRVHGVLLDSFESADAARSRVAEIVDVVRLANPLAFADIGVGDRVFETRENGTEPKHYFATLTAHAHTIATAVGTLSVNANISAEAKEAALTAQKEIEYQATFARVRVRAVAAFKNDAAARVLNLLNGDLSVWSMNAIGELIKDNLKDDLAVLGMGRQFVRFKRSINHPGTLGERARHAVTNNEPQSDPMTFEECQAFVRELADRWFEHIAQ